MNDELKTRVFVYGTLKPGGRYHEKFCGGFNFQFQPAKVRGQLFDFPHLNYPGATEVQNNWIQGMLLLFAEPPSQVLPALDELEGFSPDREPQLNEYYRKEVPVYDQDSEKSIGQGWCYFMNQERICKDGGIPISAGSWEEGEPA
ncbi:MAG: hypothetical protein CMI18_14400 [Opitutaceae bacterium]|nr:hypothetical protein [Opitutaceae bacterium]|tara:strand:- start:2378 stop:2812 length:435 start_codon:yes stop_codon:yes gene_type:complete